MADPVQYSFELKEVAELLVKKAGVKSGIWQLGINFGFGALNAGPDADHLRPSALVGVLNVVLTKGDQLNAISVDAAEVNKKSEKKK